MKKPILIFIILLIVNLLCAGELKKLTFDQAYRQKGEKLTKKIPYIWEWADNEQYYSMEKGKLCVVKAKTGKSRVVLDPAKYKDVLSKDFSLIGAAGRTKNLEKFIFVKDDDIFMFLRKEKKTVQITRTTAKEKNPLFSPDGKKIAYTTAGNLFCYNIDTKKTLRLTRDGSEEILNGFASWIYYEEILGRRGGYRTFWWSPDSEKIVFMRFDQARVPIFPIFRSEGAYGELEKQRYPKPGFPNPEVKLGIALLKNETVTWIDFKDTTDHYLAFPTWNESGDKIYFQWLNRDQTHLKLLTYDYQTKKIEVQYQEKQNTWVDFLETEDLHLLKNGDIVLRSAKDGWYHIYYLQKNGKTKQITSGKWSVTNINLIDQKKEIIYFSAKKEDSTGADFYKTGFSGQDIIKLTDFKGSHRVTVSPTGKYFLDRYSSITTPTRLDVRNNMGKLIRRIGDSYSPMIKKYDLGKAELFRITTYDDYKLPARWVLPPGFDKTRKYPVVFSVYGGPGSASVTNSFPRMSHFFLAQQDIIVFSVDHRGSGHFGKKGMDLMYRSLGKWEMHDYVQAVKYLRNLPFVDSEKIGITGGSYGGYVTALAVTKESAYFKYGIAGSSVIDWSLYDSVYTERYMDAPTDNPQGYKDSSVLTYIDNYKSGSLRIDHGTMDDNVHMQNTIWMLKKAHSAGKSIELMLYPGDRHGFSWENRQDSIKESLNFWLRKFYNREFKVPVENLQKEKKELK
jgi:dipeptidyl-peptidase-4